METTTIEKQMEEICERGTRLRRRKEHLEEESSFLVDMMLTKPYEGMEAHRRLLSEWEEEIKELERMLEHLRADYQRLQGALAERQKRPQKRARHPHIL